jgi:hypothetical protein
MNASISILTRFLLLFLSCMLVLYFIEYVIVGNTISLVFVAFSILVSLYFVLALIGRDKLYTFLERRIKNEYMNLVMRLIIIVLHFYCIDKLMYGIELTNPELTFDDLYTIVINLPIFSLIGMGFIYRSKT